MIDLSSFFYLCPYLENQLEQRRNNLEQRINNSRVCQGSYHWNPFCDLQKSRVGVYHQLTPLVFDAKHSKCQNILNTNRRIIYWRICFTVLEYLATDQETKQLDNWKSSTKLYHWFIYLFGLIDQASFGCFQTNRLQDSRFVPLSKRRVVCSTPRESRWEGQMGCQLHSVRF